MDIYTLDRGFKKQDQIDTFESVIWTDRYYGNGDFTLAVPATSDMMTKLPKGQLILCDGAEQPMILETRDIQDGVLKVSGITLTEWLNNRFIRTTNDASVQEWALSGHIPGEAMSYIVQNFCIGGPYLDGTIDIGIPVSKTSLFPIPGLQAGLYDTSGSAVDFSVPFGPVYDAVNQIATAYEIGMKIVLTSVSENSYILEYITYKGADRTSDQNANPVVRFSSDMDTFTNIRDLDSLTDTSNYVFAFAPSITPDVFDGAGFVYSIADPEPGFDLRAYQSYATDVTTDSAGTDPVVLQTVLDQKALVALKTRLATPLVDGELVQTGQINYGSDYFLGDIVEVEGNTGILQHARITEYIRSQDNSGERAYPTLAAI